MTAAEAIVIAVVIVAATVAAVLTGDVPPVLAGILGVAFGYIGKAAINDSPIPTTQRSVGLGGRSPQEPFSGAPEG